MAQSLPLSNFQWVETNRIKKLYSKAENIMNIHDDGENGFIFEVDLEYPENLHNAHNDFPFCCEKQRLPREAVDINDVKVNKIDKLLLTLSEKKNYVIHYRMLKLALNHGLVLKKVHRILSFKQSKWLKPYIDINTQLRTQATNDFEKSFFKYMINSVFGKTMENLRLRADIKLVNKWGGRCGAGLLIARPNFKRCKIFSDTVVAIELHKTHVKMVKPVIIGMSILDISKITMYSFLYDFLKPKYGENCNVCYTDTDAFILSVKTDDFYADMKANIEQFDTSDYSNDNVYDMPKVNKKVPGLFKDEMNGEILAEFVGLRAKCYAALPFSAKLKECKCSKKTVVERRATESDYIDCNAKNCELKKKSKLIKKSKGIKKNIVKREITFNDYIDCIEKNCDYGRQNVSGPCTINRKQNTIRSKMHNVYTIQQEKIALNPADDKRYLLPPNRIDTLAWGHFMIDKFEENNQKKS